MRARVAHVRACGEREGSDVVRLAGGVEREASGAMSRLGALQVSGAWRR